jgi:uncharacterized membrane protein
MRLHAARIARTVALASLLAAAAGVAVPAVAHADPPPPCYGSSCNGKDPQATGCAGSFAYTVASFTIDYGKVSVLLRYSDWCHANWTTISIQQYAPADAGEFWVQNKNGDAQYYGFDVLSGYSTYWTNMVNGIPLARSCVQDNVSYPNPGGHCTGWY